MVSAEGSWQEDVLTLVSLRAWVRRCASRGRPLEGPVSVDIPTNTAVAADSLAVLAPQAVIGLGVDEAVWVHDRRDVEVELVNHGRNSGG